MKSLLDQDTLRAMARGCAVLGAGGGGDTYYGLLQALQGAEDFGPVPLIDVDELPDDGLIMSCGGVGAPLVGLEKIGAGDGGGRPAGRPGEDRGRRRGGASAEPAAAPDRTDRGRAHVQRDRRRQRPDPR